MKKNSSSYFLTGEFANLCRTTKDTLFHYDEVGILKPRLVKDNGYRYYSPEQLYTFETIRVLKNSGCALEEINDYLNNQDEQRFHSFIDEKRRALLVEKEKLEKSLDFLNSILSITDSALEAQIGVPSLTKLHEDNYLIASPCDSENHLSKRETAKTLQNHFSYCEDIAHINKFPLGHIVLKETLFSGELYNAYVFSQIPEKIESSRLFIQPKGTYALIHHIGGHDTIGYAYQLLFNYIDRQNLHICGHAYEIEIMNYLVTKQEEDFITRLLIQVE